MRTLINDSKMSFKDLDQTPWGVRSWSKSFLEFLFSFLYNQLLARYPDWKLYFLFLGLARSFLAIFFEYGVWHGIMKY